MAESALRAAAEQLALRAQAHRHQCNPHRQLCGDGGTNPVTGSAVTASRIRMMIGGEIGHSWLVGRQIFDFAVYARMVNNLSQNIGDLIISAPTAAGLQFVSGVRESSMGADAGAFSVKVSPLARLYAPMTAASAAISWRTPAASAPNSGSGVITLRLSWSPFPFSLGLPGGAVLHIFPIRTFP